jgi:glycosyltransferase involved in cell wall biosynthesis
LKLWYFYLNIVVKKIVVFEKYLLNNLGKKAVFIPHLISATGSPTSKATARENLNLDLSKKYAIVFGYIAPYKGIKWLLENWTKDLGYELIVVGGINPNHASNQLINDYVSEVYLLANKKNINVTGFVNEDQMINYFIACDLIVLPYTKMFSSSGPLAMAWSYEKPAILSEKLKYYLDSEDINLALQKSCLKDEDLIFELNKEDLSRIIRRLDEDRLVSLKLFAKEIKAKRKIEEISSQYLFLINKISS